MIDLPSMTPKEMFVALQIDYCGATRLLEWIRTTKHLDEISGDWQVAELLSTNNKNVQAMEKTKSIFFEIFHRHFEAVKIPSPETESIAKKLFLNRLQEYLSDKSDPWTICNMAGYIEGTFEFPDWLGDMYNACDWVEPETPRSLYPHIAREAESILHQFKPGN